MQKDLFKKGLVFGIIFLFIGASVVPSISGEDSKHFIVQLSNLDGPDIEVNDDGGDVDYTFIQEALDNAKDGDVIWVYSGTYRGNLAIIKNISLIGKPFEKGDPSNILEKPVIDADNIGEAVAIYSESCTISYFTIKNSNSYGIIISSNSESNISENTITYNNGYGICVVEASNISISGNTITYTNYYGIQLLRSINNSFSGNTITDNIYYGIELKYSSNNNSISGNTVSNNDCGILIWDSSNNCINGNTIADNNGIGTQLDEASNNIIYRNNIKFNGYPGICLTNTSSGNQIFLNNFLQNEINAYDFGKNTWDNGKLGNYWADYEEKYPDAKKLWFKGIWDTPYDIPNGNNIDNYPLIKPCSGKAKTKAINTPSLNFLENHPHLFPLLRQIMRL